MAINLSKFERDVGKIVDVLIQVLTGRRNSIGEAVLGTGATSTFVPFVNCSMDCRVFLQAQNAAAVAAQGMVAAVDIVQGGFTIRHNAAGAGAKFSFTCDGG